MLDIQLVPVYALQPIRQNKPFKFFLGFTSKIFNILWRNDMHQKITFHGSSKENFSLPVNYYFREAPISILSGYRYICNFEKNLRFCRISSGLTITKTKLKEILQINLRCSPKCTSILK